MNVLRNQAKPECIVTIQPHGRSFAVQPGANLAEAMINSDVALDSPCGGSGTCGKCRVRVTVGAEPPSAADQNFFSDHELQDCWRLACQVKVQCDITVEIPLSSLSTAQHQILATAANPEIKITPAIRKKNVKLPLPSLDDATPDLLRLEQATGSFSVELATLRDLPQLLRDCAFNGTAVMFGNRLLDFEHGDTTAHAYGLAFDIGTTSLVGTLLDLHTGASKALASSMNPQICRGADVLSRILYASAAPENLSDLRDLLISGVNGMIAGLCHDASIDRARIHLLTLAGNTAMQQILCGINPRYLGEVPFVPSHAHGLLLPAHQLGITIAPRGMAYVFPIVGGFVGGDITAGMLATAIQEREGPSLLVDIGTNGEIVLAHQGRLWAASTAAGPAFEGARITCGMRAASGAIEKIVMHDDLHFDTIGNAAPAGICGSGLIDLVAELLNQGLLNVGGEFSRPEAKQPGLPQSITGRIRLDKNGAPEFMIVYPSSSAHGRPISLTQQDVREIQLGAGAIRAGISILLKQADLRSDDLSCVLLAGGFGNFIRRDNAQRIGLLPSGVPQDRIIFVGNAALAGAKQTLLNATSMANLENMARETIHVDLSRAPTFQDEFAEAMLFP